MKGDLFIMKLKDHIEAILHLLNNPSVGPYIFLENGSVINKNDIEHFIVVHAMDTTAWDKEMARASVPTTATKKRGRKKIEEKTDEEKYAELAADDDQREEEISADEQSVFMNNDSILHLIAKSRKINCPSTTVLGDDNWFICPVYKHMDGLYPISFNKLPGTKGYRLNIISVPIFRIDPDTFNDENFKDWELNSMFIFNKLFSNNANNTLGLSTQTVFVHKKIERLNYLIKRAMDRLKITQKTRIKLGNILIDEVLVYVGQEAYTSNKENIARAIKKKKGSKEEISKYDLKDVKIIDMIVDAYKRINKMAEDEGKEVPIRRESTFNNILAKVVAEEEKEHQQAAIEYMNSEDEDITMEEALELTKTLRASDYISSFITYTNTNIYMSTYKSELDANSMVERLVKQHWLWKYFEGIKGVAHISAGAIISDIDFRSTVHPSAVLRYLGLDNVIDVPQRKPDEKITTDEAVRIMRYLYEDYKSINKRIESADTLGIPEFDEDDDYTWEHFYKTDAIQDVEEFNLIKKIYNDANLSGMNINDIMKKYPKFKELVDRIWNTVTIIDIMQPDGTLMPMIKKRARKKQDKVIATYLSKDGKIKVKYSLGYNAELKSKLLQVMFDSMIKAKNPYYILQVYASYRARLEERFRREGKDIEQCKQTIFYMSRRFTIQRFLEDLWIYYRQAMGWSLNGGTYYQAKIQGIHRHGLNPAAYK